MVLRIDSVETTMDVVPRSPAGGAEPTPPDVFVPDDVLRDRLRPIVLDILEEELQRLRRERG